MDVHAGRGNERMLRRVIALLVAFAVLAERGADRSAWVRLFVLWILRRAETVAADFVFEKVGRPPLAAERTAMVGNGHENALRLAARFRALAAVLRALLPVGRRLDRRVSLRAFACGDAAPRRRPRMAGWTGEPHDTS